jgi:hypothetical protein
MARKYYDGKPYPYKIALFDRETYDQEVRRRKMERLGMIVVTDYWRRLRHEDIIMFFTFQILKLKRQLTRPWYCYYEVHGYGAPNEKEFLCPRTSMRASTIRPEQALFYRQHYAKCIAKSKEILLWLLLLPPTQYTKALHHQLLRFIVVRKPHIKEVDAYRKEREAKLSRALQ